MSSFYTVNTSNAFAALDLSDDGERILPASKAPKVEKEEEQQPAPAQQQRERPARGSPKGPRGPRGDRTQQPAGEGVPAAAGGDDVEEKPNMRNNRGPRNPRRGGRTDTHAPREGQRTYDRKSVRGNKKEEDVNPDHEAQDEAAAEAIARDEERVSEPVEAEAVEVSNEPVKVSVDDYFASIQAERIQVADTSAPVDYTDLNREIADAGFKPLTPKSLEETTGRAPGASRSGKQHKGREAQDLFSAMGVIPSIAPKNDRRERGGRGGRQQDRKEDSPKAADSPSGIDKKTLKDESEYPSLA